MRCVSIMVKQIKESPYLCNTHNPLNTKASPSVVKIRSIIP